MIITCEECSTRFTLDDSLIQPTGAKVRCSRCKHVFTAFPEAPEADDALEPDFATPGDIDFEEPDFASSEDLSSDLAFDGPDIDDDDSAGDFSEGTDLDFDDQDIEFDEIEFDEAPDFGDIDFPESDLTDPELDPADPAEPSLEMVSAPEGPSPDLSEDVEDEDEDIEPALSFMDTDLSLNDDELELESQDLDFEDIQTIEDIKPVDDDSGVESLDLDSTEDSTDIEIRFDEDDSRLELEGGPLEADDSVDDDTDLEEIEFEDGDEEADLELLFDDDPDADFIFEEPAEDIEKSEPPLEFDDADESEPGLELEEEPDFFIEEDISAPVEDLDEKKFEDYDAVLDQEPELMETAPEQEDEDDDIQDPDLLAAEEPIETIEEDTLIGPPSAADTRKKRARKTKSGVGAPVKILFLLFILVIAAYIASLKLGADIPYLSDIKIPYLTDALKPAPQAQAPLKPVPNEASINGRFVSNPTAGELFIITGRIENPASIAYSHIRVKGTLLTKDKKKAGTQTAYCGNIISEETLKTGNISDITKQLSVKQGVQNTNVNIKPGGSVLFMMVFSNLPENLTNFTVEVVDFDPKPKK